jgi:hypothetical protein
MDSNLFSALAGLAGAATGGTASFLGAWIGQQRQARAQWFIQEKARRQNLYREFIEAASECYLDALQHHKPDVVKLIPVYAKINEMRVISSADVFAAAENVARRIIDTYPNNDISFTDVELRELIENGALNVLHDFGKACCAELDDLRAQGL